MCSVELGVWVTNRNREASRQGSALNELIEPARLITQSGSDAGRMKRTSQCKREWAKRGGRIHPGERINKRPAGSTRTRHPSPARRFVKKKKTKKKKKKRRGETVRKLPTLLTQLFHHSIHFRLSDVGCNQNKTRHDCSRPSRVGRVSVCWRATCRLLLSEKVVVARSEICSLPHLSRRVLERPNQRGQKKKSGKSHQSVTEIEKVFFLFRLIDMGDAEPIGLFSSSRPGRTQADSHSQ